MKKLISIWSFVLVCNISVSTSADTILLNQSISDGETLISSLESYELGFFSPGNSKFRYLGIWYKRISTGTIVWVANRETPILDNSGALKLTTQGVLVLVNSTQGVVWSSNTTRPVGNNPVAQLLETGNLVVRDGNDNSNNPDMYLWQSFDYPGDTLMPGMKFGRNLVTGHNWFLSAWKSPDDPAPGDYTFLLDLHGVPQLVLRKGSVTTFRGGSWNGLRWTGTQAMVSNPIYSYGFYSNGVEDYYEYNLKNSSVFSRMVLNASGVAQRFTWIDSSQSWVLYFVAIIDQCDNYAFCGAYATCNVSMSPLCTCLTGFEPRSPRDWSFLDWSSGCIRSSRLDCISDGFLKHPSIKLPDTTLALANPNITLEQCRVMCLKNCSCTAYASSNITGFGCIVWYRELVDIREFSEGGQDIFIRLAASELGNVDTKGSSGKSKKAGIVAGSVIFALLLLVVGFMCCFCRRKKGLVKRSFEKDCNDLPIFDLSTIMKATDRFSNERKLGEGGFGEVYKGRLTDGQEVAVKRLSKNSGQGLIEFKNEAMLISKLQHRNLVKLLGYCFHSDERMLIYEYMPNKSLDYFIFDKSRSKILDWQKRVEIINGIARGLLYLHQDSRLRIIHRDLKASNILLDGNMNPKISDFGLARMFGGNETEANTNKVVGTYGYMSPEYAIDGLFSVKSDVYSFGVLVLEIVSGKKNRGFHHPDHQHNLLGHAWMLWMEEKPLEIIDQELSDSLALSEVLRCIHVALLCVQQRPEDRPLMSSVVVMLGGDTILPPPKQPGFFTERNMPDVGYSNSTNISSSSKNDVSITTLAPR